MSSKKYNSELYYFGKRITMNIIDSKSLFRIKGCVRKTAFRGRIKALEGLKRFGENQFEQEDIDALFLLGNRVLLSRYLKLLGKVFQNTSRMVTMFSPVQCPEYLLM